MTTKTTDMKKMTFSLAALMMTFFTLSSCSKNNETAVTNNLPNQVYGNVLAVDQYGNKAADLSNIKVTITDGTYNALVVTDATGAFRAERVPAGKYKVTFSKDGFAETNTELNVKEAAGHINVKTPVLGPKANHHVRFNNVSITDNGLSIDLVSDPAPSKDRPVSYRIFFGNDGAVDHQSYTAQARFSTQTGGEILILTKDQLTAMGIRPGTVNLTVYPDTFNTTESIVNGQIQFPTLHVEAPQRYTVTF